MARPPIDGAKLVEQYGPHLKYEPPGGWQSEAEDVFNFRDLEDDNRRVPVLEVLVQRLKLAARASRSRFDRGDTHHRRLCRPGHPEPTRPLSHVIPTLFGKRGK